MEIITVAVIGFIVFVIGYMVGGTKTDYDTYFNNFEKNRAERYKVENDRLLYEVEIERRRNRYYVGCDVGYSNPTVICERRFYAKTPKEQEIADLMKNATVNIEDLAKKLDIEIK